MTEKRNWYNVSKLKPKNTQQFIANFGVVPIICHFLYSILLTFKCIKWKRSYLLMALYFLKVYPLDDQAALSWNLTRKTWSKWVWITLEALYIHFTKDSLVIFLIILLNFLSYIHKKKKKPDLLGRTAFPMDK